MPIFDLRVVCLGTTAAYLATLLNGSMFTHSEPSKIRWHGLVPAKAMRAAKSRLGRDELVAAFLIDTVTALLESSRVACVSVITADRNLEALAKSLGAQAVREPTPSGLLHALQLGMHTIPPSMGTIIALGDLPCLTPTDVNAFLESADLHDSSFISDSEGTGSTMWARRPASTALPHFGVRSRATHRENGSIEIPGSPRAHRDVDTPTALWDAIRIGVGPATMRALEETTPTLATISGLDPIKAVDETGHQRTYPDYTLIEILAPKIGQRVQIDPGTKHITLAQ